MNKCILIMAGGTGGHVFPGLAVANVLQRQGWRIHWLGTAQRMEAKLVPDSGFEISFIDVAGVRGNGIKRLLLAPFKIAKAIFAARQVIAQVQPNLVLGMGGFAAGPGGVAARLCGLPLIIHEQNAIPGMTNKILAKLANKVLSGFPQAFAGRSAKYQYVGNPVRAAFAELPEKNAVHQPLRLLVVGGSLGAQCLNQYVPQAVKALRGVQVKHQSGAGHLPQVEQAYQGHCHWEALEFIQDMPAAFAWADLLICRAGALTVAEVAAAGLAAIFVPLPHAVDDHQTHNALSLVDAGAARLLPQTQLEQGELVKLLQQLTEQPEVLLQMAKKARLAAKTDATQRVVELCESLAEAA